MFLAPIQLPREMVETVVLACTALHDFLRKDHVSTYTQHDGPLKCEDIAQRTVVLGGWKANIQLRVLQRVSGNTTVEGSHVRNEYMEYLSQEGAIPWQDEMIR